MRPRIKIRFALNQGKISSQSDLIRKTTRAFRGLIPGLLIQHGENSYAGIVKSLESTIRTDVQKEITNLAARYKRVIFSMKGSSGKLIEANTYRGPSGNLSRGMPSWPERSERYMRSKAKRQDPRWFVGQTKLMRSMMAQGVVWQQIFGPVRVSVIKDFSGNVSNTTEADTRGGRTRQSLLKVRVGAFDKVTVGMLRNYSSRSPLMALVASEGGEDLAYRLGGPKPAKHRPTLQPFLEFFLTQAMPYTIARRLEIGLGAKIEDR